MQSDWNEIYKLTSQRTGKSTERYKEVGNFIFKSLYTNVRRPKSLIIKLKGVGTWYLRRSRMDTAVNMFPPDFDKKPSETDFHLKVLKYENKIEIYNLFLERLKEYDSYISEKQQIRKKRNETQKPIEPNKE